MIVLQTCIGVCIGLNVLPACFDSAFHGSPHVCRRRLWAGAQVVTENAEAAAARAGVKTLPSSSKDDTRLILPPANRFAAALCAIIGSSAPGTVLANALLLSHHPLVCHSAKGAASLWGGIMRRAFGGATGMDVCLEDEACSASVTSALVNAMQGDAMHDR